MTCNLTDIELIRQVLHENNSNAFGILMQRYSPQVYSKAIQLLQNEENAAEVTQMAFIQAYKQLESWHGENFGSWVTVIANHLGLRLLEKEKRRQKVPIDENVDMPEETYNEEREHCLQHLEQALSCLPEQDRQIIQWHYYEGVPLQIIAERLGQTENNIKVRLFRIRERLKKKIEHENNNR